MTGAASFAVGDVVATGSFDIDRDRLVRYAGASGDFNPIHYRDDVATSVGLPGVLAHGMLTMGLAVQPVVDRFGIAAIRDYQVRFTKPVPVPPEGAVTLSVEARIGRLDEAAGTARVDLAVKLGDDTVLGRAQVQVHLP
jgi:acyl dehydratase